MFERISTGVEGLDTILKGGLPAKRTYLLEGPPGAGKTTLALQFLIAGSQKGESVLYVALSESKDEIVEISQSHGWSLDGVEIFDFFPGDSAFKEEEEYTIFHASDVELSETVKQLLGVIARVKPTRVVIDSLSEMRLLAQSPMRYRRQILALKRSLTVHGCTSFLLDDHARQEGDFQMESIVHGVFVLQKHAPAYGALRRKLEISKMRGVSFSDGYHDLSIKKGGIVLYPRLVAAHHQLNFKEGLQTSDIAELDKLLGGGIQKGSSAMLLGPIGTGKSIIATFYAVAAARRGEHSAIFIFDERIEALIIRSRNLGIDIEPFINQGLITVKQIDPAELSPGEFAHFVRETVEFYKSQIVIIDSIAGYLSAMPEAPFLTSQLHELLTYLNHQGIVSILIMTQHGLLGNNLTTNIDLSYLADTVMLLRYFEAAGEVRKAISVIKRRTGLHETTIRELLIKPNSIEIGEPLRNFQGVLGGIPIFTGLKEELMGHENDRA